MAIGTAHVNKNGRLACRLPRLGALEFFIQPGRPKGTQVVLATARTLKDENIKNRLKSSLQQILEVEVASITLLNRVDSKDEEELEDKELEVY